MKTFINFRTWSGRAKNAAAALLFLAAYTISMVAPFIPVQKAFAADTGWVTPGVATSPNNWDTNTVTNTQASDDIYINDNGGQQQGYTNFGLASVTSGSTINGIEVKVEAKSTDTSGCRLGVALSWNGGSNYTSTKYADLTGNDATTTLGGIADNWGHTWSTAELANATFILRVEDNDPGKNCDNAAVTSVDQIQLRVTYTAPVTVTANPALSQACGLDIALVIDNSTSINSTEMGQMKTALTGFTNALAITPTEFSVTRFATSAQVLQTFTNDMNAINTAINGVPVGGGYTNWEDGMLKAASTLPNRSNPNLVIFATDGDPTTSNTVGGTDTNQPNAHLEPAIVAANTIKNGGTRILALGIGLGGDAGSVGRLKQISGPNADTGSVLTSDVITSDFSTLAADLATFANQTCGGTITTQKLIDADGNPATTGDRTPAASWEFDINGGSNPAATTTDAQGLTPAVKVDAGSGYSVNETTQAGYGMIAASCTGASNNGSWSGNAVTGIQIASNNIVRCTFVNTLKKGNVVLKKQVTNNNGGTLGVNDFGLTIGGTSVTSGQSVSLVAGTPVVINEAGSPAYDFVSITGTGCPVSLGGTVTPVDGQTITCTITNDDKPATLIVNKVLTNNNGGTKTVQNFSYKINGGSSVPFEADASNSNSLSAGTYSVAEVADSGYTTTYSNSQNANANCTNLVIPNGGTATCTITNDDKPGTLIVNKLLTNDNGGTKTVQNFSYTVNGGLPVAFETDASNSQTVNAGSYSVVEVTDTDYTTTYSNSLNGNTNCSSLVVPNGGQATCTITNNDKSPYLKLIKTVTNNNGGTVSNTSWTLIATGSTTATSFQGTSGVDSTSVTNFLAGSYTLSETGPSGYTPGSWSCVGGTAIDGIIQLVLGQSATCTIDNNDNTPKLKLVKQVTNNSGGNRSATEWTLTATGPTTISGAGGVESGASFSAGTYTLSESGPTDYTKGSWSCPGKTVTSDQIVMNLGDDITCTITNDDKPGTLIVNKLLTNDNGGTKTVQNFSYTVNGGLPVAFETDASNSQTVNAGSYSVVEVTDNDYTTTYGNSLNNNANCSNLVIPNGGQATCTITNNDIAPKLTLNKILVKDNGGNASESDWELTASGVGDIGQISGLGAAGSADVVSDDATFKAGTYTLSESAGPSGYTASAWSCSGGKSPNANNQITLNLGDDVTCTITNDDKAPSLKLVKKVVNDNGGKKAPADWTLSAAGPTSIYGYGDATSDDTFKAGAYTLGETDIDGYHVGVDWSCSPIANSGDKITLGLGQATTCEITNDDDPASISGTKTITNTDLSWINDGKPPVSGWVIYLDQDQNGVLDTYERSTTTDADGNYNFGDLVAGVNYYVNEVITSLGNGWEQITGVTKPINLTLGQNSKDNDFSNKAYGHITVIKQIEPDTDEGKFNLLIDGVAHATNVGNNGTTGSIKVEAGTHTVGEELAGISENLAKYYTTTYSCNNDMNGSSATITNIVIAAGSDVTCTFANTRKTGTVKVVKDVVNDNGGTKTAAKDFTFTNNGGTAQTFEETTSHDGERVLTLPVGSDFNIVEPEANSGGYATSYSGACSGTVTEQKQTCTITNNDQPGTLIVKKIVTNDNGGSKEAKDFHFVVNDGQATSFEADGQNNLTVNAGKYSVTEVADSGYATTYNKCTDIVIANGSTATCTIKNDDIQPKLTVIKHVVNDGTNLTKTASDFTMNVTGSDVSDDSFSGSESGVTVTLKAGSYSVSEAGDAANYAVDYSADCKDKTIAVGETKTCTVTNTAILKPQIHVVKTGPAIAHEDDTVTYGYAVTNPGNAPLGTISLSDDVAGDGAVYKSGDANTNNLLEPGEQWLYEITYQIPTPQVDNVVNIVTVQGTDAKQTEVTDTDTHTLDVIHPSINVAKSAPDTAHEGDVVTYTFTVTNTGDVALSGITVIDDIAGTAAYQSGDTDNDDKLDITETWIFTKQYTIPADQTDNVTNTATAKGTDPLGQEATDTDTHNLDVLHPSISVEKDGPVNAQVGTKVTYIFTVKNTGDTPLDVTTVADDIAGAGAYDSGDTDNDNLLDISETWVYKASAVMPLNAMTVKNTVDVCALDETEIEVCNSDSHETIVYMPQVLSETTVTPAPTLVATGTSLIWATLAAVTAMFVAIWVAFSRRRYVTYN